MDTNICKIAIDPSQQMHLVHQLDGLEEIQLHAVFGETIYMLMELNQRTVVFAFHQVSFKKLERYYK
jgi:hypothetical protein